MSVAEDLDLPAGGPATAVNEESAVARWRERQAKRSYPLYRIVRRRRAATRTLLQSIMARRAKLYGELSETDAPALTEKRRYRRIRR